MTFNERNTESECTLDRLQNAHLDQEVQNFQDLSLFDNTGLKDGLNHELPLPAKFTKWRSMPFLPVETRCCRGAIVSLIEPYKVMAASAEFLRTIQLASDDVCGRHIDDLVGPSTETLSIHSAIKNTSMLHTTQVRLALVGGGGHVIDVTASFLPYRGCSDSRLTGCLLQIDCVHHPITGCGQPVFIVEDFGIASLRVPQPKVRTAQRQLRRAANQTAGMENEEERQRQQVAKRGAGVVTTFDKGF